MALTERLFLKSSGTKSTTAGEAFLFKFAMSEATIEPTVKSTARRKASTSETTAATKYSAVSNERDIGNIVIC